ncbi:putative Tripeptidyl-peptidase I [Candidatus Sulfopaludibacter sp. SbA3]|nr:putative Tripeptidyl-peptidase I [Candidatus Sulfopaludibacter sp. SbA3]
MGGKYWGALALFAIGVQAQTNRVVLKGNLRPWARPERALGKLPADTRIGLVTLFFQKTARQQAELETLLEQQQDTRSGQFRRWLSPEEYGERFGIGAGDAHRVAEWLASQGLTVDRVGRGRAWVTFSGSAARVERAFHTEFQRYKVEGEMHFAASREPSVPTELAPLVAGIAGLDDFRPKAPRPAPFFTASNGSHELSPGDFAAIYDLSALYGMGIDGSGQTIVIAGQSDFDVSDASLFRSRFGLPPNDPQVVVYGPPPPADGEWEFEERLDVEWSGAVAPNAKIILVTAASVMTAIQYAIDDRLAPVISLSSGDCEPMWTGTEPVLWRAIAQQANAEGITWVSASGDSGAAACTQHSGSIAATLGKTVDLPPSIPEVTAVGGTQFNESGGMFWNPSNDGTGASVLGYIPESAWNESAGYGYPRASGGGASALYGKPAWQSGPGVPADNARDVLDVSFPAGGRTDPYLIVFRGGLDFAGGTSVGAPAFAGVVALVNQFAKAQGLGNINPHLYRMAQTTPGAFHDVTTGDNIVPCIAGTPDCVNGSFGYAAGPGYDLATGLGTLDVFKLVTSWSGSGAASTITVSANPAAVTLNDRIQLSAVVAGSPATPPTGTVTFLQGNRVLGSAVLAPSGATSSEEVTLTAGQLPPGSDAITAVYGGDAQTDGSAGSVTVVVALPAGSAAVVPTLAPNPVHQSLPDANGNTFVLTITLQEMAGTGATVTDFTIDGISRPVGSVFASATLAPKGTLAGTIRLQPFAVPATRVFGVSGRDAGGNSWTQQVPAQFLGPAYFTEVGGISNAASGGLSYAPGMLMSVYGQALASRTETASSLPLPLTLSGVTAAVNGVPAPLYFVSPDQINVQIPYESGIGTAMLEVNNNGQIFTTAFRVDLAGPGIFTDAANNTVPFSTGSRGQVLTLFITGDGQVSPPIATGTTPPPDTPLTELPRPDQPVTLTVGGINAFVFFVGIPSGLVGVTQLNFQVPQSAPLGAQPVVVTVGGRATPAAILTVTP